MLSGLKDTIELANGVAMPRVGFGTYKLTEPGTVEAAVTAALETGYRSIDTASLYGNEVEIGTAIAASAVPREEIFLTTKVWNDEQGYDETLRAFDRSLDRLGTDYVDLYLVHWPRRQTPETWRALEHLYAEGRARAIGVCNHLQHHMEELLRTAKVRPMVNQYEMHPWLQQPALLEYCKRERIVVEAWAPIIKGRANEDPQLVAIAGRHGKTAAQVCLRWELQQGVVVIPKSSHPARIAENADLFDFELSDEEMALVATLDRGQRTGPDPDVMRKG